MLKPEFTGQFKKDYKLAVKRGCNPEELKKTISLLCSGKPLPEAYKDHMNILASKIHYLYCNTASGFCFYPYSLCTTKILPKEYGFFCPNML